MEITWGPLFVGGLLAGWGVAVPLGAIGLLVVREAMTGGFRAGASAALAVAMVDGLYCAAAVLLGAAVAPVIASWGAAPALCAGLVLVALGVRGLMRRTAPAAPSDRVRRPPASGRVFATFAGLTLVNPATLLYFAALTAALPPSLGLETAPLVFVAGAVAASISWQLVLVALGTVGGGRIGVRGEAILSACGYGLVVVLGAAAVIAALRALV
ncbi:hypothetical protein E3T61_01320 [Cryobacterium lactosi]|uniref:Lysine transporter LysE n=1 Tax=Cryobacterium lactosi TaxID=1259202 RepID=A0A4V3IY08_9MICO|nr:LysE family transporter [Cryobacterium lactosi]TFD94805.1 hypothetical protein E3T61_01320 [Cryobacterium lactosi]